MMSGFKNLRFIALTFYHILAHAHPAYVFLLKALRSIQGSKTVKTVKYNYLHSKVCVVVTMTFYYYHLSLCAYTIRPTQVLPLPYSRGVIEYIVCTLGSCSGISSSPEFLSGFLPGCLGSCQGPYSQTTCVFLLWNVRVSRKLLYNHRRRINTEKRQRSSRLFGGQTIYNSLPR